jgi:hypothetical protein
MKKFQLHLDAVIVIILLFVGSFAFIVYQDYQYEDLLQETVDQRWEIGNLKANEIILRTNLERCEKERKQTKY